jgi:hypothetical protein
MSGNFRNSFSLKQSRYASAKPPLRAMNSAFGTGCAKGISAVQNQTTPTMARGSKSSYSPKQKRKASHIEKGYEKRGVRKRTAKARAWATVNKQEGGAKGKSKKSRSAKSTRKTSSRKKSSSKKR